tara:strand:- start:838 stop:1011 length:174 start_codon:yes stop_codon:yes gene_type:complete
MLHELKVIREELVLLIPKGLQKDSQALTYIDELIKKEEQRLEDIQREYEAMQQAIFY